jgi:type IV pilus assembly protein PilE
MRYSKGFTLIELMIVVAIVGILSAIAIGYYGDNVISANRTEGRATLTQVAGSLEKCRSLYGSYNHANCNVVFPLVSESNYYSIDASGAALASTSFTLTASPVAGKPQANDTACTTMTLTNTGIKAGTGADPTACW